MTMKRFWKWVLQHKLSTIRKWRSVMAYLDRDHQQNGRYLKPIGGSDDNLEWKQKRNSKILQEETDDYLSNLSLQDFQIAYDNEPIDFNEFFDESSIAIESALEKKNINSISNRKISPAEIKLSLSPSPDNPSGSFRYARRTKKPTILITNMDNDNDSTETEDDLNGEFDGLPFCPLIETRKQQTAVPQMSTLLPDEICYFPASENDESNILSSSTVSSNQPDYSTSEIEDNQIVKCHKLSLAETSSISSENDKEKLNERKKKLSLQNFRLYNMQVERPLSRHRSTETLPSLTSAQIHLIRNIWRQVYITKGPTVIGSTLLNGIFFKSKKIKEQFFQCPFPHRFPNRDSFNKAHAKAIGGMLDMVIDNLENLECLSGYLFSVGATHANLGRRQVSKEIWNLMAERFIDCTLDWGDKKGRTEATRKAWALTIAFVIEKIKRGHLHKRRQLAYHGQ